MVSTFPISPEPNIVHTFENDDSNKLCLEICMEQITEEAARA